MPEARYQPLVQVGPVRPEGALRLAGGWGWFTHALRRTRGEGAVPIPAEAIPAAARAALTAPRPSVAGVEMDLPRLMAILNVTPDSFSDGGVHLDDPAAAAARLVAAGADILDVGGESTRPGAAEVAAADEIARAVPAVAAAVPLGVAVSIDTRKAAVAEAAADAGAAILNDVTALSFDPGMAPLAAARDLPVVLMHSQGSPETMQDAPRYDDVLLDVYDHLEARIAAAEAAGIARARLVVDPGIGFGKTLAHNLTLMANLSLFHGLGCPVLLGASRKRFIGTLAGDAPATARLPGSLAAMLAAVAQGVQIARVHDVAESRQALTLWRAATTGAAP
ncbi:dihydropteroate synthase [Rhodobacteraceae bacterium CCMM004]|nr:dihydropteroate synthase [Rhodobacteraceae bacterium CCMM004]